MKLNGWQRIGVVLSALWLLIVLVFVALNVSDAVGTHWVRGTLVAVFLPILAFWVVAYAALFAFRWVRSGFSGNSKSASTESVTAQSRAAVPLTVDSHRTQQLQLEPAPQPQDQFKLKGFITRARNGKERLWIVFWVYTVLGAIFFRLLFPFISAINSPVGGSIYGVIYIILMLVFSVLIIVYLVWVLASLWKCAFNVDKEWRWLGYLARAYVVWGVGVLIYSAWMLWSH
jgi:hypothetical protein